MGTKGKQWPVSIYGCALFLQGGCSQLGCLSLEVRIKQEKDKSSVNYDNTLLSCGIKVG